MNDPLSSKARALLEEVVVGDRSRDDAAVRSLAENESAFRIRLDELDEVRSLLDETADDAHRSRDEARAWAGAPGEESMQRTVGLATKEPRANRWGPVALFAAVAAAGIALVLWLGDGSDPQEPVEPVYMGQDSFSLIHPTGPVERYDPLQWTGTLPAGGEFHVRITDATGAHPRNETLLETYTRETSWSPTPDELERLTQHIVIEIRLLGGDGNEWERTEHEATR